MGQHASRKSGSGCSCGWERRREPNSHVHRYVAALTDRWSENSCRCRRSRPPCVCTAYRRDEDLAATLRRELHAIVTYDTDISRDTADGVNTEVYLFSVAPRGEGESLPESIAQEIHNPDGSLRLHPQIQVVCGSEIRALLLRTPIATNPPPLDPPTRIHTQVDYIHCLVPDLKEITACSFYWGKMDRYEAERLLENKPEGTFLLRDSAQEEHLFSVSFRKYKRSLHARIEHSHRRFSFDAHDPAVYSADTVTDLIDHYKDPACVMFFEPMLTAPLPRSQPFSLQQLSRAVIVSHITYDGVELLPLPPRLRAYLKEYHYRQRVRVRTLEPDGQIAVC